eukprot:7807485-Karenia_brevis.AAC.1
MCELKTGAAASQHHDSLVAGHSGGRKCDRGQHGASKCNRGRAKTLEAGAATGCQHSESLVAGQYGGRRFDKGASKSTLEARA